jgi:choline dehydrogenase-like flavoprotein
MALMAADAPSALDERVLDPAVRDHLSDVHFDRTILANKLVCVRKPVFRWKDVLLRLARESRCRCLLHAPALELVPHQNGTAIKELLVGTGGGTAVIRADTFVICAGALETPRLLLNSRRGRAEGLGNEHGLVGRFLMDHPAGHYCKLRFGRKTRAPLYSSLSVAGCLHLMAGLRAADVRQRQQALANHYVWLRPSVTRHRIDDELLWSFLAVRSARNLTLRQIVAILTNRDLLYRILVHRFGVHPSYRFGDLFFMTEQLPNPDSRVTLSETRDRFHYPVARIDWRLTDADLEGFHAFARLLLGTALCSPQYSLARRDDPAMWEQTFASAAHHLGTARMAEHPHRGVVDRNLKVFGTDNLFVCDGSVFATAGSVNPSLTITALAFRLADHVMSRNGTGLASGASSRTDAFPFSATTVA